MKCPLLLPLLLLGRVSALHLENVDPHLESPKTEGELGQLHGAGEQEGELVLTQEMIQTEREEEEASGHQDAFEEEEDEEEAMESEPAALDKDSLCPREEDTIQMQRSPGCKTCRYLLVRTPKTFRKAQNVCRRCYGGNLVSIHSYNFNYYVHCLTSRINQAQVWIGGILKGWFLWKKFCWTDGSCWDFGYWAQGQPTNGKGHCVALCTKGGYWRRAPCRRCLPFVCSS
uniref:C-type lectin domain-containing protein n=1 Tax=Castor canadensis TaxID=51338 RepID=A0A8C0WJ48_CASCN